MFQEYIFKTINLVNKWGMCPWDKDKALLAYKVIKGHNSRLVKVMLPKFILDLSH